jgi:hypothetical protein
MRFEVLSSKFEVQVNFSFRTFKPFPFELRTKNFELPFIVINTLSTKFRFC